MFIKRAPAPWTMLVSKHDRSEWCLNLRPLTIKSIFFYGSCLLMHGYPRWEMIGDAWRREHFLSQLKCEEVLGKMQMGWNRAPCGMQQNRPRGKNKGSRGKTELRPHWWWGSNQYTCSIQGHLDARVSSGIFFCAWNIWPRNTQSCFSSSWSKWSKEKHLSIQRVCQRQRCPPCYILNYAERICMPVRKPVPISASEITFQ